MQVGMVFAEVTSSDSIENRLNSIFTEKTEAIDLVETLLLISKHWNPSLKEKPLRDEVDQLVRGDPDDRLIADLNHHHPTHARA